MIFLLEENNKTKGVFENYDELFEQLEKENLTILELNDGELKCKNKQKKDIVLKFGELSIDKTKEKLIKTLEVKRDEIKAAMDLMNEQGITLTVEQKEVLNNKYGVLASNT